MHAPHARPLGLTLLAWPLLALVAAGCGETETPPPMPELEVEVIEEGEAPAEVVQPAPPAPPPPGIEIQTEPSDTPPMLPPRKKGELEWAHPLASDDPDRDVRELTKWMADEKVPPEVRAALAGVVGEYRRADAVDSLLEMAESDDPLLVEGAVKGLKAASANDPRAAARLRELQSHPHADVQAAAQEAVKGLD
jgi:hypothetical protein